MKKRYVNNLILLIIALIWGAAFVAQSAGMDYIGPFTFNSARSILGGIVLIPVIYVLDKKRKEEISQGKEVIQNKKTLIIGGICCGFFLMLGSSLQQIGIQYTTAGKAGFITALYILIVPILGLAVGKKAGNIISPNPNTIAVSEAFKVDLTSLMMKNFIPAICAVVVTILLSTMLSKKQGVQVTENDLEQKEDKNLPSMDNLKM